MTLSLSVDLPLIFRDPTLANPDWLGDVQRGVDTVHVGVMVVNDGLTDVSGASLVLLAEKTEGELDWSSAGHPSVDEVWGRFQLTGIGGTNPGQENVPDGVQPMGHLASAELPTIKAGNWILGEFWLRQPADSAGGSAVAVRLQLVGDEPAKPVARGVEASAWGVISHLKSRKSYLIEGGKTTATDPTPDDQVHVSPRSWLLNGREFHVTTAEDITLDQNDANTDALATGESYFAALTTGTETPVTVTKGVKSSGTPAKPTLPADELFLAFVLVAYGGGGSVIASGDVDADLSYGRLLAEAPDSGHDLTIHAGESLTGGYQQFHGTKETVVLDEETTNIVWMQYGGALAVTQSAVAPSSGAIPLWRAVTDDVGVVTLEDLRPFAGNAWRDAGFAGGAQYVFREEDITLDTGAAFTDSLRDLLPANSWILSVPWVVLEDITGAATGFSIGDAGTADRFQAGVSTIAAGDRGVGLNHAGIATAAMGQATEAALRITLDDVPDTGKIRVQVHALQFTAPSV